MSLCKAEEDNIAMQGYRQVCAAQTGGGKTLKIHDLPHQTKETGKHLYFKEMGGPREWATQHTFHHSIHINKGTREYKIKNTGK